MNIDRIRLSDTITFIDCTLLGNFTLQDGKIISKEHNRSGVEFKIYDIVRLEDCFCKIDTKKMCKLRMIIRKMEHCEHYSTKINTPFELSQYTQNR